MATLSIYWNDPQLAWDLQTFNNVTNLKVPGYAIWTPSLILQNGIAESLILLIANNSLITLDYQGNVSLSYAGQLKSTCLMDLTYFPYDSQNCTLKFSTMDTAKTYNPLMFQKGSTSKDAITVMYTESGEFTLSDVYINSGFYIFGTTNSSYPVYNVSLFIKRNSNYYVINVAFPAFLLSGELITAISHHNI